MGQDGHVGPTNSTTSGTLQVVEGHLGAPGLMSGPYTTLRIRTWPACCCFYGALNRVEGLLGLRTRGGGGSEGARGGSTGGGGGTSEQLGMRRSWCASHTASNQKASVTVRSVVPH